MVLFVLGQFYYCFLFSNYSLYLVLFYISSRGTAQGLGNHIF